MAQISARRLEISAVLVENSKRLADFCPCPTAAVVWHKARSWGTVSFHPDYLLFSPFHRHFLVLMFRFFFFTD